MKIVFIQPAAFFSWEALNIGYLGAYCKEHAKESLEIKFYSASFDSEEDILAGCRDADIVGFSCTSPQMKHALYLAKKIKAINPRVVNVFGGVHPSALPEATSANREVDMVVVGEGEESMLKIIHGLRERIIQSPYIEDLDKIPHPDRHLIKLERHLQKTEKLEGRRVTSIFTTRGCPFKCFFCASHAVWKRKQRTRSPENIAEEFALLSRDWQVDHVSFADDEVGLDKLHFSQLCDLLIKNHSHISWGCNMVVSVMDAELLKAMWAAGCRELWLGVESGSPRILRDMHKPFNLKDIRQAFKITKELGFIRRAYILLGMPNETREDIEMTDRLIEEIKPDVVGFTILAPFPGTAAYDPQVHKDIDWSEVDEYHNKFTKTKTLTNHELHQIQKDFVKKYHDKIAFHHKLYD